jgi:hypothetical protein
LLFGSFPEPSVYVAALSVLFALDRLPSDIARAGGSTSITVFQPTSIDSRPLTHRELRSTAIVTQSSEEARKVWLAIKQYVKHEEDTFILPPSVIDSWVWHVDFRGPKSGDFSFGSLRNSNCCTDASRNLATARAIQQLEAAGGQARKVDWTVFEQAIKVTQGLIGVAARRAVRMETVLELQTRHMELSRQATNIMETVDVLFDPMRTCLCHSASERIEQDRLLIDSLILCGISIDTQPADTQQGHVGTTVMLIGATGRDGEILDIARELEKTMLYWINKLHQ